ncbi:DUF3987 domain-containing protein, partial [Kistimonas scapharcae]|uniref:DUF3987 domain-containing protein n=1 Tax=Kistimonas scapharcae TaxID=1036133 RepID=UPI0031EB0034
FFSDMLTHLNRVSRLPLFVCPENYNHFIVNDTTVEQLGVLLSQNPVGLLLVRDELNGWLAGLNRDDRQTDRAFWLEAFNGNGSFSYDRVSRDGVFIKSNTMSVIGGIQPIRLLSLLKDQDGKHGGDGLIERLQIMVYPDTSEFQYVDKAPDKVSSDAARKIFERFNQIEYRPDEPVILRFDDDAQSLFDDWYTSLMQNLRNGDIDHRLEGHLGKYPSLMPTLAVVFHLMDQPTTTPITADAVKMAMQWCDVLMTHAERVYALLDNSMVPVNALLSRLDELSPIFKQYDLEKKHWSGLTKKDDRQRALDILVRHNYLRRVVDSSGAGRPTVTFHVNPKGINGH